jgi:O-antigen/teichoic acid export membrane protein
MLMAFIAGEAALGFYAVAVNASETLLYLSGATGLALLPRLAAVPRAEGVETTLRVFRQLLLLTAAAAIVAALLGPPLLPRVFGGEFEASVNAFLLLLPGGLGYAALTVFTNALAASSAPGRSSAASFLTLALGLGLDVLLIPPYGAAGAAAAASAAFLVGGATAALLYHRRERFAPRELVPRSHDLRALGGLALREFRALRGRLR